MKLHTKENLFRGAILWMVVCSFVFTFSLASLADIVILQSGQVVSGTVLQQDAKGVMIKLDYGTFTWPNSLVKDVRQDRETKDTVLLESPESGKEIPSWGRIISELAKRDWGSELKQIPATVIDQGVLRNVPYISFRCASGGYELNIYGDLDHPAGVEIGVLKWLLKNDEAKSNCVDLICAVLASEADKQRVRRLNREQKDSAKSDALTFEITLSDEADAYGGWWVSVYDEAKLDSARASAKELKTITEPIVASPSRQPVTATTIPSASIPGAATWSQADLGHARPSYSSPVSGSGGSVYVRGYTRKNGTYVHSYTRRK